MQMLPVTIESNSIYIKVVNNAMNSICVEVMVKKETNVKEFKKYILFEKNEAVKMWHAAMITFW